jgi:hypothetical protein
MNKNKIEILDYSKISENNFLKYLNFINKNVFFR